MRPFKYISGTSIPAATKLVASNPTTMFLAGGTNLLDLMKEDVERPIELVDLTRLQLSKIVELNEGANKGGVSLGSLGKNSEAANHKVIRQRYPLLSQAIFAGASAQIRNMATNGGNLMQRTRCPYFYDVAMPCNKRAPGTGCGAYEGINRMHAIFGWNKDCVAVYPSDMAIALAALDAVVKVQTPDGKQRIMPFADFHRLPGDHPEKDTNLEHGELITSIELPANNFANHSYYLKVRDRASYAFALVSVAVGLEVNNNKITNARIALGGVAHKPWRAYSSEKFLIGKEPTAANFEQAAAEEMAQAMPLEHNKFKVELGKRGIARALYMAMNQ
jgi:xanthine dehydrogenase YagS FAD-binding subunit